MSLAAFIGVLMLMWEYSSALAFNLVLAGGLSLTALSVILVIIKHAIKSKS